MLKRASIVVLLILAIAAVAAALAMRRPGSPAPAGSASGSSSADATPRAPVTLDTRRQQLIGVRTVAVERATLMPEIRVPGAVAYDETRQTEINTRVDGWIRELYADYTGRPVRRGEALFTLYSPDLVATQNEYLLARRGQVHAEHGQANVREYSDRLAEAARERLTRFDMTDQEIAQLEQTGKASDTITFHSPVAGVIVEKAAVRGMQVMAGEMLFRVTDLSTVWVEAEVYESDLARVRVGQPATVTVTAYADRRFAGRVSYIAPEVSPEARTVKARITLSNPGGLLKPNMLATVSLQTPRAEALVLPPDAVVDTGTRQIVFVSEGEGHFAPREVKTGRRTPDAVEVVSGLEAGEQVAASATFFLDSESQLQGALRDYTAAPASAPAAHEGHGATAAPDITFRTEPDPPHLGDTTLVVSVKDAQGQPIADAGVTVVLFMPAMPSMNMPAMRSEATLVGAGGGLYRGTAQVPMPGRWSVTVNVTRHGDALGTRQFRLVAQ